MGWMDEYNKALKKYKKEPETQKTTTPNSAKNNTSVSAPKGSWMDEYNKALKKHLADDDAPVGKSITSRMTTRSKDDDEEDERKWFQKGLFEDGYDFGDISKTILGSLTDVGENLGVGIMGMGEKALDALAYLAPAANVANQAQNSLAYNFDIKEYRKQQKDSQEFIKKDLYDEEAVAKAIISDPVRFLTGVDAEKDSVFVEKSDSLIQSGGQLLGTMGLQAAGVPWFVTSGVTSFGSEAENAFNQGASYEQAGLSAAVSAGAEMLTEKLFGGSGLGEKGLVNLDLVTRGISNKLVKALADYGVDMAAEGAEEVASQFASNFGSALYREENMKDILLSEEAFDEYLESFIGGAALGGLANASKFVGSAKKGTDYRSDFTQNEQKVVDKVYQDRLAELEKKGKVTAKQKSELYEAVSRELEKGYISIEDIEAALGGDTYEQYKQVSEWEDSLQQEFDTLHKMKRGDMTGEQIDRENHLRKQIDNVKATSSRNQLKTQLSEQVFGLAQGDRLVESYNEKARRGQAFEADLTQYDSKQQAVIQKAVESGVLNNTNRTHELVDMIAKISADKGVLFDFTNNAKLKESGFAIEGKQVNGYVTKDGVTLNVDSPKYLESTVGHEITHVLEGTEFYTELQNTLFEYAKSKGEYDSRLANLTKLYEGIKDADVNAELTADLVGDYLFRDPDFINNLSVGNRNVFQKVYDEIKYLCKVVTAGSKEARELERVKKAFEDAYRATGKAQTETKYSLTPEQQEYFKDSKVRDENGNLKVMYHGTPNGDFTVFKDGTYFTDNKEYADTYQNPGASSISSGKVASNPKTFEVYLDIKKPFDISDAEARDIYINDYIKGGNAMGINPYLSDAEYSKINTIDWTEGEDLRDFLIDNGYDYDGLVLDEGATGGYGDDVKSRGKSYVVFSPEQVKNVDNTTPTANPDIRYSLSDSDKTYIDAVKNRDWETAEKLFDEAAEKSGYTKVVYHGTDARFTEFDTDEESTAREQHAWMADYPDGTIFLAEDYDVADGYGERVMNLLLDTSDIKVFEEPDMYAHRAMDDKYGYEVYNYPVIAVKGKDMTIYATLDNTLVKSADTATYDDNGELIPLSERFNHRNPDIRFSLSESVEETKELMAIHNLHASEVLKQLEMGGMPYPSVAITNPAKIAHEDFGDISIILNKDAIDPKKSKYNRIYSSDAYTPTFPHVSYEASKEAADRVIYRVNEQFSKIPDYYQRSVRSLRDYTNLNDYLNRWGGEQGLFNSFVDDHGMKQIYLAEKGEAVPVEVERTETQISDYMKALYQKVIDRIGVDAIKSLNDRGYHDTLGQARIEWTKKHLDLLKDIYAEDWSSDGTMTKDEALEIADEQKLFYWYKEAVGALEYLENGGLTVVEKEDFNATNAKIDEKIAGSDYKQWLSKLFSGIEGQSGIRNNKETFTPRGTRRSFSQLHDPVTIDNVIKAMRKKEQTGQGAFGTSNFNGAAVEEYGSIAEAKRNANMLGVIDETEYKNIKNRIDDQLLDIARRYANGKDIIDAKTAIVEAVAKNESKAGIARYLKQYDYVFKFTDDIADDIIELRNYVRSLPRPYFEAKPRRAVGFDEVGVFVIPYDADVKLKQELLNRGYAIAEYDPKVEGDRQRVVNQFEEYKFSLSNVGEEAPLQSSYGATLGKDVRLETEDVAPISKMETTTPELETIEFPDDGDVVHGELERLTQQRSDLEDRLYALSDAEDFGDEFAQLSEEWADVSARIKDLENSISESESGRIDSLTDADMPPETDAPYYGESDPGTVSNPFENRDWYEVGTNRSARAFMVENPEFQPFFQSEAMAMLGELGDTQKAERWYNDQLHYESGGEKGFGGQKRFTSQDIARLLDEWHLSYAQIEEGLTAIIENNGKVNNAPAKRIEFMLNDRLLNGYKDFHTGQMVPPNQEYQNMIREWQVNQQARTTFDSFMPMADQYAPAEEVAPVKPLAKATPDTVDAPVFESKEPGAVKGQTTLFEPEKPKVNPKVARVLTEESAKTQKKPGIGSKLVGQLVDKGMVFENLSLETGNHELQAKWNYALPSNTEARAQYFMEHGADGVPSLKEAMKPVNKSGKKKAFFDYMYQVHNIDRMTLDVRFGLPNITVYGDTETADVSRAKVAQYEKANPEFKEWAKNFYAINKHLRSLMTEKNIISQKTSDWWETKYPHYVPIRRAGQEGANISVPLDTNKTGVNNPVQRATGGSSDIEPLDVTMAQRIEQIYRAIARNDFGIELKNALGTTINSQQNNADVDEMIDTIEAQEDHLLKPGTMHSNPTFTVFENGERVEFEITNDMYDALKPAGDILGHRFENSDKAPVRFIGKALNARRNLLTTWNPVFALYRNPVKDLQDVAINSQHAAKTYMNIPNAIYQMATDGKYATEYHKNGGKSNTYFDSKKNEFKAEDNIFKKTIGMPIRAIETAGEFIEEIPRLAEYIASRQAGRSVERSMLDAARVTTNFAAGGDFTKFLNSHGFTFLNASVQGASQHVRNFREATKQDGMKGFTKVLAKYVIAGLPSILLNSMLWDDDEDYEELNDYVKQNYYVIAKTEDGKFVRIPKGRTAAVMGELMGQMENLVTGDDEVDFSTFYELFMNNIAPSNPLENNILAPIGQVMSNTAWYGGDLVPSRLQKLPAEEQFDESTDSISKWLGEKTGTSPYKWNYLIDQYSGGLGDTFLPMLTPEAESGDNSLLGNILAPWKKEITTDSVLNNKNPGDFYDLKDELEVMSNSKNATDEDKMRSMYMDSVSWEMGDLYAQKREIQNSDLPDDEKYEAVRSIQNKINHLANNALDNYSHVNIDGLYSEAGDKRFNYNADNDTWYEIKPKKADGSDNYYYQQEQRVTKKFGISYGEYWNNREEYDYAYDKPEQYAVSKVAGGYKSYRSYTSELWDIKADKDKNGKSINGSRKEKVIDWLNELDADYGTKLILFKNEYNADDTYNYDIISYVDGRTDISYEEKVTILKYLGFEVDSEGNVTWD